jgi:hypothetical protein
MAELLLDNDIPCGKNNAFAPSLAAWHRMVLNQREYVCEKCHQAIPVRWRDRENERLPKNFAHHIISQNMAVQFDKQELRRLLTCGIAYCDSCHWDEHRRLGGWEFTGALTAFRKFKGLELVDKLGQGSVVYIGIELSSDKKLKRRYESLLDIALAFEPSLKSSINNHDIEYKALYVLSGIFYLNVFDELELLGWERMSTWKKEELIKCVDTANDKWNATMEQIAERYNHSSK